MEKAMLSERNMKTRAEAAVFLKALWSGKSVPCPICGNALSLLHQKAKKSTCDRQCTRCGKIFRTISLLDEMNEKMP